MKREEDIYNRIYWVKGGDEQETIMLGRLLASVSMNCLVNIEEDGGLEGSAKLVLKVQGDTRQEYIQHTVHIYLAALTLHSVALNASPLSFHPHS